MTDTTWPILEVPVNEAEWRQLMSGLDDGVADSPSGTVLKVSADGSAMSVSVAAGFAAIQGFGFNRDAAGSLAIAASTTLPRIDTVVLRYTPASGVAVAVVTGTPAASPSKPTLTKSSTGVWEVSLAHIAVGANVTVINAIDVTDARRFLGRRIQACLSTNRPTGVVVPQLIYETDTGRVLIWTGAAWVTIYDPPVYIDIRGDQSGVTFPDVEYLTFTVADSSVITAQDIESFGDKQQITIPQTRRYEIRGAWSASGNGAVQVLRNGTAIITSSMPSTVEGSDVATMPINRSLQLTAGDLITVKSGSTGEFVLSGLELTIEGK